MTGFLIGLLRGYNKPASIVRYLKKEHKWLQRQMNFKTSKSISDPQFRRLLSLVNLTEYNNLNDSFFEIGISYDPQKEEWYATDGKELRGSIDLSLGHKRGESVVRLIGHQSKEANIVGFYNGQKESEKPVVKLMLEQQKGIKITFDALHTDKENLEIIHQNQGQYIAQVKNNQPILVEELTHLTTHLVAQKREISIEKSHGRIERREASFWDINTAGLPNTWHKSGMASVVLMERKNLRISTGRETIEQSFYVSNIGEVKENSRQIFDGIRGHWGIESDHFVRDTLFKEDDIQCRNPERIRIIASAINISVNLLRRGDENNNLTAFRQEINMDKTLIFKCLTKRK
jgi:predicted transposase YbfD/YdcC